MKFLKIVFVIFSFSIIGCVKKKKEFICSPSEKSTVDNRKLAPLLKHTAKFNGDISNVKNKRK